MRSSGMPKQFLEVFGKPIIIYTLEKFEKCEDIDKIVISCNASWIEYMNSLINQYRISKILEVVLGGNNRQESIRNGIIRISKEGGPDDDIVVIHDGVRPLVQNVIISENIRIAKKYGCANQMMQALKLSKKGRIHTVLHRLKPLNWGYWKRYMKKILT